MNPFCDIFLNIYVCSWAWERSKGDETGDGGGPGEESEGGGGNHTGSGPIQRAGSVTRTEAEATAATTPASLTAEGQNHPTGETAVRTKGQTAAAGETEGEGAGTKPWGGVPETDPWDGGGESLSEIV